LPRAAAPIAVLRAFALSDIEIPSVTGLPADENRLLFFKECARSDPIVFSGKAGIRLFDFLRGRLATELQPSNELLVPARD
jgi:hypothetical protein